MSDEDEQNDELLALTSIFDDSIIKVTKEGNLHGGELSARPVLPEDFHIKIGGDKKEGDETSSPQTHHVKYLPPITLNFLLPSDYPSCSPPQYTLSCKWLNRQQLTKLCQKLDEICDENKGSVVLFMWNSFLQDELFDYLDLHSPLELSKVVLTRKNSDTTLDQRAIQEISSQSQLLPVLLEYNKQEKERQFEMSSFLCQVCFTEKTGKHCMRFYDCDHVYCLDCMKEYFSLQITEGNVKGLECPEEKCETQAHPTQVQRLVSPELFAKYDKILLQTSLDMMMDVTFCPRPVCQSPVLMEQGSTLCTCPQCHFSFCSLCKLVYHGISPCRLKADKLKKLREDYMAASPEGKRIMEKTYGKVAIQQAMEESFTNEWLSKHSKQCPDCGAHIQKIDGCNKMTCMKCRGYFCWLCNERLSRANPYLHFNVTSSPCFNQLFQGVNLDRFEDNDDDDDFWDPWDDYD